MLDHANLVDQTRREVNAWGRAVDELKRTLALLSVKGKGRCAGFSVRYLSTLANREEMPVNSSEQIVLAVVDDLVFLQLFDEQGGGVLNPYGIDDSSLRDKLARPPRTLTGAERERTLSTIVSVLPYERRRLRS